MTLGINLGGTVALRYDDEKPVLLDGESVLHQPRIPVIDLDPVQSFALEWLHLTELRSTILSAHEQGETRFAILSGTDSADEVLYFLNLTLPSTARAAVIVSMQTQNERNGDATDIEQALRWLEGSASPRLALWCDSELLEPPLHEVFQDEQWRFRSDAPDALTGWHISADAELTSEMPVIPIVPVGIGAAAWTCAFLESAHFDGVVIEAFAAGDAPPAVAASIGHILATGRPVVLSSRSRPGRVSARFPQIVGSSDHLMQLGALSAGTLKPYLARLRLALALAVRPRPEPSDLFVAHA